jgi:DNA-binding protein
MINSTTDYTTEKFLIDDKPVMMSAMDVLQVLNKINRITIIGKGESCPATVSVANIITQNILNGKTQTDKILVDSEVLDDGSLISTIEILITKIAS